VIELRYDQDNYPKTWPKVNCPYRAERGDIAVRSVSEVRSAMDKIMAYEEQTFMPLMSEIQTLESVHHFLHNPAFKILSNSRVVNHYGQLLIAYLVKPDNLDALIVKIRASISKDEMPQMALSFFDKTVELIKLELASASV
jgi:hypothetical protein